jgi:hypothetical protein
MNAERPPHGRSIAAATGVASATLRRRYSAASSSSPGARSAVYDVLTNGVPVSVEVSCD